MSSPVKTRYKSQAENAAAAQRKYSLMKQLATEINNVALIEEEDIKIATTEEKVDLIINAMDKINERFGIVHDMVNDASDGPDTRLDALSDANIDIAENVDELVKENKKLRLELDIAKGLISKQHEEIAMLRDKVTTLTARSMSSNITISGIIDDKSSKKENCKEKVITFFKNKLEMEVKEDQVQLAHRMGNAEEGKTRPMVVKCHPTLKTKILKNKPKLKDVKNENDDKFYINKQLPDQWVEENRELNEQIFKAKATSEKTGDAINIQIKNRVLYVNHQPMKKYLQVPKPAELFVDQQEQEKIEKMKWFNSDCKSEKGSSFAAFATKCSSITEVRRGYVKMKQTYPEATHIMAAYMIRNGDGYQDDREFGAASKILKTLEQNNVQNLAVYVVRKYGGQHLGPRRHQLIRDVVEEVLAKTKIPKGQGTTPGAGPGQSI